MPEILSYHVLRTDLSHDIAVVELVRLFDLTQAVCGKDFAVDLYGTERGVAVEDFPRDGYLDIVTGGFEATYLFIDNILFYGIIGQ